MAVGIGALASALGAGPQRADAITGEESISTVAGGATTGYNGDNIPAVGALLGMPAALAADGAGRIYIADAPSHRVRRIDTDGVITTIAGTGAPGFGGDEGPATAAMLNHPGGLALDAAGNLYIGDTFNRRVRKVDTSGVIHTIAGNGLNGSSGDNGPATGARLTEPIGVAVTPSSEILIADAGARRVRKVRSDGTIATVAGNGIGPFQGATGPVGDGGPATAANIEPWAVLAAPDGGFYISGGFVSNRIRKVDPAGTITTIAGTGSQGYSGDGGPATAAQLFNPKQVVLDNDGNLYVADDNNHRVRKIDTFGIISTVAGTGVRGNTGDGGSAINAELWQPNSLAIDSASNLYVGGGAWVRKVSAGPPPDTTPPVLSGVPDALTVEAGGVDGATADYTVPTATDDRDGTVEATCTPPPGALFPLGTTMVTCSAEDTAHNSAGATFAVSVVDTSPPSLTSPGDLTVQSSEPQGAPAIFEVTATDVVSGTVPVTCTPASGSMFPIGSTTVDCRAVDGFNNEGLTSFVVTVSAPPPAGCGTRHCEVKAEGAVRSPGQNVAIKVEAEQERNRTSVELKATAGRRSFEARSGTISAISRDRAVLSGQGSLDRRSGYTYRMELIDARPDTVDLTVIDANGTVAWRVTGTLSGRVEIDLDKD